MAAYIQEITPRLLVALDGDPNGATRRSVLGRAVRRSRWGRWDVVVAGQPTVRHRWSARSARRTLYGLASQLLTRAAIRRARLDTYRPGFDDRLRDQMGWL